MRILGIHFGHDATASLIDNGHILAVVAEERITRKKHQSGFPIFAINEVLRLSGLSSTDIDAIAIAGLNPVTASLKAALLSLYKKEFLKSFILLKSALGFATIRRKFISHRLFMKPIYFIEHHICHASSAYRTSGIDKALILTVDGFGDSISSTVNIGENGNICRIAHTGENDSIGLFYQAVTESLGFIPLEGENKTMGLAAYGDPNPLYSFMSSIIDYDKLSFRSKIKWTFRSNTDIEWPSINEKYIFVDKLATNRREDLASACQKRLEDVVVEFVKNAIKKTGIKNICAAGGVFLNVKVNKRIMEETGVDDFYIFPDAGDGGTALGAALELHHRLSGKTFTGRLSHVYYGTEYTENEIEDELKFANVNYTKVEDIAKTVAIELINDKVVGWFQGKMEMGPRALGNRSVLSDPRNCEVKNRINLYLKKREWFVPFAPSILAEYVDEFFINYREAPFMVMAFDVKEDKKKLIPAVVHVDGTTRPQVVRKEVNQLYWKLITEFYKLTGIPMVLNTSFNKHGLPIVRSPRDAIEHFKAGCVDILAIGNYIVSK
ncbi:MAG: carbamoyltransferase C-terminal domain-containing protein [bacterium]|nr:carbamoyltransferase C-terminal domain-containing protein [bacterium]